jgi:hypothetical protein
VYKPEKVARDILAGIERNRYIVITGWDTNLFYWLTNLLGPLQYPVIDILVADAVRKKAAAEAKDRARV